MRTGQSGEDKVQGTKGGDERGTHFVRAQDAAERVARLMADPEPENPNWKLFLATAMSQLDLAVHQATWERKSEVRSPKSEVGTLRTEVGERGFMTVEEHNAFPKGRWS